MMLKNGFSLVELMIVVAIIGVLASIAIPNFNKYQARVRQTEAKTSLSQLYTSMQAFKLEWQVYTGAWDALGFYPVGEYRYNFGFDSKHKEHLCGGGSGMGKTVSAAATSGLGCGPKENRKFLAGRGGVGSDLNDIRCKSASTCTDARAWAKDGAKKRWGGAVIQDVTQFVGDSANLKSADVLKDGATGQGIANTTVTANMFRAGAAGDPLGLGAGTAANRDAWTIDEHKTLQQNAGANVDL